MTLCLYSQSLTPQQISAHLGLEPSEVLVKDEVRNPNGRKPIVNKLHAWFLSSEREVRSRDLRRHIDWLLERVAPATEQLRLLALGSVDAHVSGFWLSAAGHDGPTLSPPQLAGLAALGLDFWLDLYPLDEDGRLDRPV